MKLSILVAIFVFCGTGLRAEIPELTALREKLINNSYFIRGHNANTTILWTWKDGILSTPESKFHMMSVLQVSSVELDGNNLKIKGTRLVYVNSHKGELSISSVRLPAQMNIDIYGADISSTLPKVPSMIFYLSREEALAGTPLRWALNPPDPNNTKPPRDLSSDCDCSDRKSAACMSGHSHAPRGLKEPKLIHHIDPDFTEEGRKQGFDGSTEVYTTIGTDGHLRDIWIAFPLQYGLDEKAADAVSQYVFKPATCHDKPVETEIYIDVNFQKF